MVRIPCFKRRSIATRAAYVPKHVEWMIGYEYKFYPVVAIVFIRRSFSIAFVCCVFRRLEPRPLRQQMKERRMCQPHLLFLLLFAQIQYPCIH